MYKSNFVNNSVLRGEIYYIIKSDTIGSEQETGRPAVVVSNNVNNQNAATYEVVYLTTREKNPLPTHTKITATGVSSTVLCEQISTVARERLGSYIGTCTPEEMKSIDKCLIVSLALDSSMPAPDAKEELETDNGCDGGYEYNADTNSALIAVTTERDIYKAMYETLLDKIMKGGK